MKHTLEFPASELVQKIRNGEIASDARLWTMVDVPDTPPTDEEIARRQTALQRFFTESATAGVVVDDSREGISGRFGV